MHYVCEARMKTTMERARINRSKGISGLEDVNFLEGIGKAWYKGHKEWEFDYCC